MFRHNTLGAFLSCEVAMARQIPGRDLCACDEMTLLRSGDIKRWYQTDDNSAIILIDQVIRDWDHVPAFLIRFKLLWTLEEWLNLIAIELKLPNDTEYSTIVQAAIDASDIIDKSSLLNNIKFKTNNYSNLDKFYVAACQDFELPSVDPQTKRKFTVTKYVLLNFLFVFPFLCFDQNCD